MLTRRTALAGTAVAAGQALASRSARAAEKIVYAVTTPNISVGNAVQSSVPLAMNYWKDEGLDASVIGLAGTMLGVQQIATGAVQFATAGPETTLIARQKGLPIVAVYVLSTPIYETVVDEPRFKSYRDLKGTTIGVPDMASGMLPYARSALKDAGLDPDKDVTFITTGLGSSAATALRQKEIAAWASYDTAVAALENGGFKFSQIDPAWLTKMPGNVIITHETIARDRPEIVVGFLRGLAKATVFALANPEATVRNHWQMYPSTKPQEVSAKTFAESLRIFNARMQRAVNPPGHKWGENVDEEWDNILTYSVEPLGQKGSPQVRSAYTNRFIDQVNKFDEAAVVTQAKASTW